MAAAPSGAGAAAGAVEALLAWFDRFQRPLPWRESRDPYRIWVSEIMLQQTRVETVIPYYQRWLERFPDLPTLAQAPEEVVLQAWAGLGYYARARNFQRAAQEVCARYGGAVPADAAAFARLPGVGAYTTGAVMSMAFDQPLPAVDGNVLRVLARWLGLREDVTRAPVRRRIQSLVSRWVPEHRPGDFNQALMELGATVCLPRRPHCPACPLVSGCQAFAAGEQVLLPVKTGKAPPRVVPMVAGVVVAADRCLVTRRPSTGLLGGMWQFPGGEVPAGQEPAAALAHLLRHEPGVLVDVGLPLTQLEHAFSHLVWRLTAFQCSLAPGTRPPAERPGLRWVGCAELANLPLPKAFRLVAAAAGLAAS